MLPEFSLINMPLITSLLFKILQFSNRKMAKGLCDRQLSRGKTTDKHEEKKSSELNY